MIKQQTNYQSGIGRLYTKDEVDEIKKQHSDKLKEIREIIKKWVVAFNSETYEQILLEFDKLVGK